MGREASESGSNVKGSSGIVLTAHPNLETGFNHSCFQIGSAEKPDDETGDYWQCGAAW